MAELFAVLAGVAAVAILVATPVLALIAWSRSSERGTIGRRLRGLEHEIALLRARLEERTATRAAEAPTRAPTREPTRAPSVAPGAAAASGLTASAPTPSTATPSTAAASPPTSGAPEPGAAAPSGASAQGPRAPQSGGAPETPGAPPPPVARPAPPSPAPAPRPPRARIDWERWAGVRGAAVLGGALLALAAILLFRHALENEWIGARARVVTGAVAGLLCIVAAVPLRRRGVAVAPNALEGAGVVALFAAVWASYRLYGFLPLGVAFPLEAGVTALACVLSLRHRSRLVAALALAGGFATAWLLHADLSSAVGLFAYLLVLDVGLLLVARRTGWTWMAPLALAATLVFEWLWVVVRLGPDESGFGLAVLGAFALVFAAAPAGRGILARATRASSILLAFALALRFGADVSLGLHLAPTALLLALLLAASCVLARQGLGLLPAASSAAALVVAGTWLLADEPDAPRVLEGGACLVALAALVHLFAELEGRRESARLRRGAGAGAAVLATGALLVLSFAVLVGAPLEPWPWWPVALVLALLLARLAVLVGRELPAAAGGFGLGVALACATAQVGSPGTDPRLHVALEIASPTLFLALGLALGRARRGRPGARGALRGAVLASLVVLLALLEPAALSPHEAWLAPVGVLALAAVAATAAVAAGEGAWILAVVAAAGLASHETRLLPTLAGPGELLLALALAYAAAAAVVLAVALAPRAAARSRAAWIGAALAAPLQLPAMHALWEERLGDGVLGLLYLAAAAPPLALGLRARAALADASDRERRVALGASFGAAAVLAAIALPIQVGFETTGVAAALSAAALALVRLRTRLAALGWLALVAGAIAAAELLASALEPRHFAASYTLVPGRLTYAYVLSGAALLAAAALVRREGAPSLGRLGAVLVGLRRGVLGLAGIVVLFAWVNLLVLNRYPTTDGRIALELARVPGRDLAMSIAWAVYAIALLAAGSALTARTLRWASLVLFLVTLGKVFLHDLGELQGLYRVGSVAGLAVSLLLVSLVYQRFVFRSPRAA